MFSKHVHIDSPNVVHTDDEIRATLLYRTTSVELGVLNADGSIATRVRPVQKEIVLRTQKKVPKVGALLVGWGGNNGTTVTAGIIANRLGITWQTKEGVQHPNYFGSITQASSIRLGTVDTQEVYAPMNALIPMVHPNDLVLGGWDVCGDNLSVAMQRARVLDVDLQRQLIPHMDALVPMKGIYSESFIAPNQAERATHIYPVNWTKKQQLEQLRSDIKLFKESQKVDKVIVLWTATTERFCELASGVHDSAEGLLNAIENNHPEVSPSTLYALAAILEGCSFINGAPQNTLVPGLIAIASQKNVFVAGDDFKSGQTKLKSVLVEYLVGAGIKPECIASYNHLGNNDGYNLSNPPQFRSKEITKSNVVDDMVMSNQILYPKGSKPDHCIVIKYLPFVGDSKRAMDEYISSIFMNGRQTFVIHNTCEDSLLAAPLILDLIILMELMERVTVQHVGERNSETGPERLHTVASLLSYLCKSPVVPDHAPVINALYRQKQAIENFVRVLIGLEPDHNLMLESRLKRSWGEYDQACS